MTDHDRESEMFELIDGYVHGLLSETDRAYVERRIADRRVWAAAHEEAKQRLDLLGSIPATEPSESLIEATLARVASEAPVRASRRRRIVWRSVAAVAAVIALFLGVNTYFVTLKPRPYDLRVFGQDSLIAESAASVRVMLVRPDGEGIEGVPIKISLEDEARDLSVQLASFVTDDAGTGHPSFAVPDWAQGEYRLRISAGTPGRAERIVKSVTVHHEWRVSLSTDKPAYQPGQTLLMRSLALRQATGRPVAGERVEFEVIDAGGNVIFREASVTSRFGIASAECPLADLLLEGVYTVRSRVGEVEASTPVEVKRYVLPAFRTELGVDRPFYAPGEVVRGRIEAAYYFRKPVAGEAEVVVSTIAEPRRELGRATVTLDAGEGTFSVALPQSLPGTPSDGGDAGIRVSVAVRDSAGQEAETSVRRVVTTRPLRVTLVPEGGRILWARANEVFVFVTTPDGRPAEARVIVEGLSEEIVTGPSGVGSFALDAGAEEVRLAVRAVGKDGRSVSEVLTLASGTGAGDFVIRTDAAAYDAGSTITASVIGWGDGPTYVDVIRGGQTVATARIAVENGRGAAPVTLPPEVSGPVRLVASRFDAQGWLERRECAIYVRPNADLRVDVTGIETSHRPGETAKLTFQVRDGTGVPAPGAISLSIFDEAVLGVLDGRSPMEAIAEDTDAALLEPIYAVYPWNPFDPSPDPNVSRAVGSLSSMRADWGASLDRLVEEAYIPPDFLELLGEIEPDRLDEMLERMRGTVSDSALDMMRRGNTPAYSLRESTYEDSYTETLAAKQAWADVRALILFVTAIVAGLGLFIGLCLAIARMTNTPVIGCLACVLFVLVMIGLMLPALGKARASARQLKDESILRGLAQGIELADMDGLLPSARADESAPARVREWFPETLLWRPELITDDQGLVRLSVPLADSITNWEIRGGAITTDGRVGPIDADLAVFQPFFVGVDAPVALVRGDEIELPIVIYNYLDAAQRVDVRVTPDDWFEAQSPLDTTVALGPGEVKSVGIRIRASEIGTHRVLVRATGRDPGGAAVADAIRREITVVPEGERVERVESGTLREPVEIDVAYPADAVEGSRRLALKLYPSTFSQVLEGLEGIFARPYGCFEQTSSTTYPNVLALDYLRRTGTNAPEVEARALRYIHLGYQRLLTFEVPGGGFDWFGNPPANVALTAYGLMEFEDMARVRHVDPRLIERTRAWLMGRQNADGSWSPGTRTVQDGLGASTVDQGRLVTTAYVAWSAFGSGDWDAAAAERAAAYLLRTPPESIDDPYALAMVALGLASAGDTRGAQGYAARLVSLAKTPGEGLQAWSRPSGRRTMFYGAGPAGDTEATALATIALLELGTAPGVARGALAWLVEARDLEGSWGTTQATVLALRALVMAAERPLDAGRAREIVVETGGTEIRRVTVEPDQSDVVQLLDLTDLVAGDRSPRLTLRDVSGAATAYQLAMTHHRPFAAASASEPLGVDLAYDAETARVGEWLGATATLHNRTATPMPMVLLDLPIPAGFEVDGAAWALLVETGEIAKFELTPRSVVVYLRALEPGETMELRYRVRANTPVEVEAPGATASEYYDPEVRATSPARRVRVLSDL